MWNSTLPLILTFQRKFKAVMATLVHVFPLKNLENLTFRRHCSSPGKVVSHHKTLLYVQFLDIMQNMKLHLFLCLDFAKIRVRTIDQKWQNFSLFDRKTLCITQLQCKHISNYFIYLIYFKFYTWYVRMLQIYAWPFQPELTWKCRSHVSRWLNVLIKARSL